MLKRANLCRNSILELICRFCHAYFKSSFHFLNVSVHSEQFSFAAPYLHAMFRINTDLFIVSGRRINRVCQSVCRENESTWRPDSPLTVRTKASQRCYVSAFLRHCCYKPARISYECRDSLHVGCRSGFSLPECSVFNLWSWQEETSAAPTWVPA